MANSENFKTIGELHAHLEVLLREHGNLPLSVSVYQETENNPHGSFYEDRALSNNVEVVDEDGVKFVELAV